MADKKAASSVGSVTEDAGASDVDWTVDGLSDVYDDETSASMGSAAVVEILEGAGVLGI
ncbi:hypothetical protein MMC17_008680, partial [Xylographa soralifera]|nr:hypothetical protein [Xylographa soralifera]